MRSRRSAAVVAPMSAAGPAQTARSAPRAGADAARCARSASGAASPTERTLLRRGGRVTEVSADPLPRARPFGDRPAGRHRRAPLAMPARAAARSCRSRPTRSWSRRSSTAPTPASATPSSTAAPSTSRRTCRGAAASSTRSAAPIDGGAAVDARRPTASQPARPPRCRGSASARRLKTGVARHRHLHAALLRPAARHLRRLRRRQVDAARHARRRRRLRHGRGGAGRRTRPRGARIPRRHDRPQEHGQDRRRRRRPATRAP